MNNQSFKILLVEDSKADADSIEAILDLEGMIDYQIENVSRVKNALESLSQKNFDVILLDLSLPDSQGIDGIAQIKQQVPDVPIVVLTMLNDFEISIQALREGAQDYLAKGRLEGGFLARSLRYAIERQRTEKLLRQQAQRERLMAKMLERIRQSLNLQDILDSTAQEVNQFLNTDLVTIYRYQSEEAGEIVAASCDREQYIDTISKISTDFDFSALNLSLSKCNTIQAIEDTENGIKNRLIVPIWQNQSISQDLDSNYLDINETYDNQNNSKLWGILIAHHYDLPRQWQVWEKNYLQQLSTQLTIAIKQSELYSQLKNAYKKLEDLAIKDALTGIANRRQFDRILNKEWQRLAREQKPLSIIFCDVDFFKAYNDTYGHLAGDNCLQKVAKILTKAVKRPADLVARYGGEEFAIILPDTNNSGAIYLATKIRKLLEDLKIPHQKSLTSPYVTISMGVATKIPNSSQPTTSFIQEADRALYQAKAQGRNKVFSPVS